MTTEEFHAVRQILKEVTLVIVEVAGKRVMIDPQLMRDFAAHALCETGEANG